MTTKPDTSAAKDDSTAPLRLDALARRRALLSGLGKGGAALAAAVPIRSLAGSTVLTCMNGTKRVNATVSGCTSAVHSFLTGGGVVTRPADGKTVACWAKKTSWPCSTSVTYSSCLGVNPYGGGKSTLLCDVLINNGGVYGTECPHWAAAYLNGMAWSYQSGKGTYPYPHVDSGGYKGVQSWCKDAANGAQALLLFKMCETQSS